MKLSTKLIALLQTLPEENTALLSLRIFIYVILSYFHYVRPSVTGGINGLTMLTIYFGGREHTKQRGPTKQRKTVVFNLWIWVLLTFLRVLTFSARSRSKIRSWGWKSFESACKGGWKSVFFWGVEECSKTKESSGGAQSGFGHGHLASSALCNLISSPQVAPR